MTSNPPGQKILIINPDGSIKQLSTDANGNLNVNAVGVTLSTTGLAVESGGNLAAIKADLDTISAAIANVKTDVDKIPSSPATESGNLASIKSDLDTISTAIAAIKTDVDKIPSSPATESGNLASIKSDLDIISTAIAAIKTDVDKIPSSPATETGNLASIKSDLDTISTNIVSIKAQLPTALASDGSEKVSDTGLNWKPSVIITNSGSPYTSTASYATAVSGPIVIARPYSTLTIHVKENNVNSITYQIVGYLETSTFARPIVLSTGIAIAKNADDYEIVNMGLAAIDIQVMDTVGGTHGQAIVDIVAN